LCAGERAGGFEKFASTCQELKVELPYDKDHFVNECKTKRFHWMVEMALKHSPKHFESYQQN
jgi:hypothetical protein